MADGFKRRSVYVYADSFFTDPWDNSVSDRAGSHSGGHHSGDRDSCDKRPGKTGDPGTDERKILRMSGVQSSMKKRKTAVSMILILCLLFSFLAGCQKKMTFQDYLDLGDKYLMEANYEEAIVAFTKAIEIDPKQAAAYGKLADLYLITGETEKAVEILKQGYENTGDESLRKRAEELETPEEPEFTPTVNASVYPGTMTVEIYAAASFIGYMGKDVYTYDEIGRMISCDWYDFDGSIVETNAWSYDDEAGKTYGTFSKIYHEGMESEPGKENGQESAGPKGERLWNSTQEQDGCKDQARYYQLAGYGEGATAENPMGDFRQLLTDPTKQPKNGKITIENSQYGEYGVYEYDSLGRVSSIYSYTSDGAETGHCAISYSKEE